ncbi:lysoplasmalogenase family protein [Flavobacterium phycosphaerae]|uniref:lysoplasmalogenase family protein n=1 Tax=Flavobacterium phycosphaerae TaxID=2697515 RepID=UPI00138AF72A|nr:lysoplasmalogenase family protein [Flavobacterium phycosphaerae]
MGKQNVDYLRNFKKNKLASLLLLGFLFVSFIEIIGEYNEDKALVWLTKPLILPLLIAYYLKRSKKISNLFIIALLFSWVANLLFIQNTFQFIVYGVIFFVIYRILIIYIIVNKVKMPSLIPLVLGSIPFIFIYVSVTLFTYNALGDGVYLFLLQGIFTIFLGGFSLGNYIMVSNKPNSLLLISTMFMAFNQFVFLLKLYYHEVNILQAFAMILFVLGQLLLTMYMFHTEKQLQRMEPVKT